jgi:hypothetical protein
MNNRKWIWLLTFIVASGMALSGARSAAASPRADKLPSIKNPSAAKFNMTGRLTLTSGDQDGITVPITGNGLISGDNSQLDLTAISPGGSGATRFQSTNSQRLIDGKFYSKTSTSPGNEGKWYVTDATGVLADNPLGGIGSVIGLDSRFEEFIQVEELDKEVVEGVSATKYGLEIDFKSMAASVGTDVDMLGDVEYVMDLWIGDEDGYIHKVNYALNIQSSSSEFQTEIGIEYDITFYDFDVPVTIEVPSDAETLDMGSIPGVTGGMPTSMGDSGMTSAGMPKSGAGRGDNTMLLALLALGMSLVLAGAAIRRAARARQSV